MKVRDINKLKKVSKYSFMRDVTIDEICSSIKKNKNIFFLNADMGAPALDKYIKKHPKNIVHCGISEQNMVTVAAGLALEKNSVFCYAMTPFMTARCYEQLKISLSSMNLSVCVIGIGPGIGYADAGPTHYANEDIGIISALPNFHIFTPSDSFACKLLIKKIKNKKVLSYFRIDRDAHPSVYKRKNVKYYDCSFKKGFNEIIRGNQTCIISSGYLMHKIMDSCENLAKKYKNIALIDLYQHSPVNTKELNKCLKKYKKIIIIDEQSEKLGTKSILFNCLDHSIIKKITSYALKDRFIFENGGRDYLLSKNGIDIKKIINSI